MGTGKGNEKARDGVVRVGAKENNCYEELFSGFFSSEESICEIEADSLLAYPPGATNGSRGFATTATAVSGLVQSCSIKERQGSEGAGKRESTVGLPGTEETAKPQDTAMVSSTALTMRTGRFHADVEGLTCRMALSCLRWFQLV